MTEMRRISRFDMQHFLQISVQQIESMIARNVRRLN